MIIIYLSQFTLFMIIFLCNRTKKYIYILTTTDVIKSKSLANLMPFRKIFLHVNIRQSLSLRINLATLSNRNKCQLISNIMVDVCSDNQIIPGSDGWKISSDCSKGNSPKCMAIVRSMVLKYWFRI